MIKPNKKLQLWASSALLLLVLVACNQDKFEEDPKCTIPLTYADVENDIINTCATSGCHDGSSGIGDYKFYNGIQGDILNKNFEREVFITKEMPPSQQLDSATFMRLKCWADNGYVQ